MKFTVPLMALGFALGAVAADTDFVSGLGAITVAIEGLQTAAGSFAEGGDESSIASSLDNVVAVMNAQVTAWKDLPAIEEPKPIRAAVIPVQTIVGTAGVAVWEKSPLLSAALLWHAKTSFEAQVAAWAAIETLITAKAPVDHADTARLVRTLGSAKVAFTGVADQFKDVTEPPSTSTSVAPTDTSATVGPTDTATPTDSATPTGTGSDTATPTGTGSGTASPTGSASASGSASGTAGPTPTGTDGPTPTGTAGPTPTDGGPEPTGTCKPKKTVTVTVTKTDCDAEPTPTGGCPGGCDGPEPTGPPDFDNAASMYKMSTFGALAAVAVVLAF